MLVVPLGTEMSLSLAGSSQPFDDETPIKLLCYVVNFTLLKRTQIKTRKKFGQI